MDDIVQIWNDSSHEVKNPNFRIFIDCISNRKKKWKEDWSEYSSYVYQKASFLISKLPGEYDPAELNRFFEKMNAAGRQLTPVEQIKSKYFSQFSIIFDACLNFEKKYVAPQKTDSNSGNSSELTLREILDDSQTKVEAEPSEEYSTDRYVSRSILRPTIFLLHVLNIVFPDRKIPLDENKLIEIFKNNKTNSLNFIQKMQEYRTWLDENIVFLKYSDRDSFEYAFRTDDIRGDDQQEDTEQEKLRQFQSMLYVSSSDSQQWVLEIYQGTADHRVNLELLKQQDAERHPLPSSIKENMNYYSIDRYWFWKLDYVLWEHYFTNPTDKFFSNLGDDEKNAVAQYRFVRNRSIKHLHPQTDGDLEGWKEEKHQFGNLAMISSSFNSSQQNDTVGVKFARLKDTQIPQKSLESVKMLLMFAAAEGQENRWTIDSAKKHGEEMYKLLQQSHVSQKENNQGGQA